MQRIIIIHLQLSAKMHATANAQWNEFILFFSTEFIPSILEQLLLSLLLAAYCGSKHKHSQF